MFPSTMVVSQQGQFNSISEAIKNAQANDRILVRPGIYREGVVLDKHVEIVGEGPQESIILESSDVDCILMQTDTALVQGLTLRCRAGLKNMKYYAVDIPKGQLILKDCEITSDSLACVAIHGSEANPTIQRCKIHSGKQQGIIVYENGQGTLEDCDIFGNTYAGVAIEGSNLIVRSCRIHDGKETGVYICEKSQSLLENCDIFAHASAGVWVSQGSTPIVRS